MQPHVTLPGALALTLPNGVAVLLLLAAAASERAPLAGWRRVTPGAGYWGAACGSLALSSVMAWVWLWVGSSRPDGASQMQTVWWLSLGFAVAGLWCAFRILALRRMAVRWRGAELRWFQGGREVREHLSGAASVGTSWLGDRVRVVFRSGAVLSVDAAAQRATELVDALGEASNPAEADPPPDP